MVRKYKRKTDKAKWTAEDLKKAKKAIADGLSKRKAAEKFQIPCSTLRNRLKQGSDSEPSLGRKCDFPPAHEESLAGHVKAFLMIYGITATKLRKIAFEYAEENNLNHRFNKRTKMAGFDWMYGFLARNKISVRRPEDLDILEHQDEFVDVDSRTYCNQEKENNKTFKNTDVIIKTEPGISDTIYQPDLSQDGIEDPIAGCSRLKENDAVQPSSMVDVDNPTFCKHEDENHLNSKNGSTNIKTEPDLSDCVSQEDVSQQDTIEDSISGCSRLKGGISELVDSEVEADQATSTSLHRNSVNKSIGIKEHSYTMRDHSSAEGFSNTEKTSKTEAEKVKNRQTKMCDQQQQTNEIPTAAIAERWMINWCGDKPIAEPVLDDVKMGQKRPMTAAERKRKSREKQRAEAKFFHHMPDICSCGIDSKKRDKLKAEVDALTHRKELLSAQITLLQAHPQQMKLSLTENDSEDDLSNVSTNDSSMECSRVKEVSLDSQLKMKRAILFDKDHEINNDSFIRKNFFGINGMLDDFQVFGEFVATELRNLKSDLNRRRLKRMIQKVIIEVSESEDR